MHKKLAGVLGRGEEEEWRRVAECEGRGQGSQGEGADESLDHDDIGVDGLSLVVRELGCSLKLKRDAATIGTSHQPHQPQRLVPSGAARPYDAPSACEYDDGISPRSPPQKNQTGAPSLLAPLGCKRPPHWCLYAWPGPAGE